jgi:hypothetical protein
MKYRVPVKLNVTIYGVRVTAKSDEEARLLAVKKVAARISIWSVNGKLKAEKPVWQVPVPQPGQPGRRAPRKRRRKQ